MSPPPPPSFSSCSPATISSTPSLPCSRGSPRAVAASAADAASASAFASASKRAPAEARCVEASSRARASSAGGDGEGLLAIALRVSALAAAVGMALWLATRFAFLRFFEQFVKSLQRESAGLGAKQSLSRLGAFVGLYAVGGILFVPAPVMSVAAGALFSDNLLLAMFLILSGSLLGACSSFLFSRFLLRSVILRHVVAKRPFLRAVDFAVRKEGLKILLCARMVLPYTLNNYFLGVTGVTFWQFALATFLTGFPFALAYAAIGAELPDLDTIFSTFSSSPSAESPAAPPPAFSLSSFFFASSSARAKPFFVLGGCALLLVAVPTVKRVAREILTQAATEANEQVTAEASKVKRT
ncbi:SNARE associated protein [Besnoitia besnoiti]|uniref:SNARE associated protein n=1 Tax=Besnoitia besnoiti TaxID=94643 RepID=A0A2A9MPU1_BESBE|nr:SNARE associated protein [Besnoitia besnoiti]PFH38123.1 SNARE associated protein [Besnoitia besnoiti]